MAYVLWIFFAIKNISLYNNRLPGTLDYDTLLTISRHHLNLGGTKFHKILYFPFDTVFRLFCRSSLMHSSRLSLSIVRKYDGSRREEIRRQTTNIQQKAMRGTTDVNNLSFTRERKTLTRLCRRWASWCFDGTLFKRHRPGTAPREASGTTF